MSFLRALLCAALAVSAASAAPVRKPKPAGPRPVDLVDPFIGTGGHGHTFPGPSLPFGMIQPGPDTRLTGWDGCSAYHFSDSVIYGFSHTHLSGVGVSDYGDILLLPATGPVKLKSGYHAKGEQAPTFDPSGYGSHFRKDHEQASAGYYAVSLDDYGVKAELTATLRAGLHRYTFERAEGAHVLLDLQHRDEVITSSLKIVDDHTVEGLRRSNAWAADQPVYFVVRFSKPFRAELAVDDQLRAGLRSAEGKNLKAVLRFQVKAGETVLAKVGLSGVDVDGARRNLDGELPGWDFEGTRRAAHGAWARELDKVEVEGGTDNQRAIFYTALYHAFLQPNVFTDVDGRYLGRDLKIHRAAGYTQHTVFSLWDTFRAAHPLYTILETRRTRDFIQTFLAQAEQGGLLPVWELWGNETGCMIGNHAIPVIVDAYLKGIRGFDAEKAFEAMKKSAMQDRLGFAAYRQQGYIPFDQEVESVSKTLEYGYNDWCIAQMAKVLGKADDYAVFLKRSQAYQHLLDPETGLMRPKANGHFKTPFDPAEVDHNYTEANAWQYSFFVPHDISGHMARLGGPAGYAAKLDEMFAAASRTKGREQVDITGLVGQYAHGNEPSHHMAYLYSFAGQPWKTQAMVRRLMNEMYHKDPDGLIGNEDCGQMSSWFVLSAMGFYPVNPCGGEYVIGSPLFSRVTLKLENGKRFVIQARGEGPYVQSVKLNGQAYGKGFLRHVDIKKGGMISFTLGQAPNQAWGSGEADRPHTSVNEHLIQPAPYVAEGDLLFQERTAVKLASPLSGAVIHFTLDGTTPTEASPRYEAPIELRDSATLSFVAFAKGLPPSPKAEARFKRMPVKWGVDLQTPFHPQYSAGGANALVDGIRGGTDFRLGGWQGFLGTDLVAVVDLRAAQPIRKVALGCLQDQNAWIFMPAEVTFELSLDGQAWGPALRVANPVSPKQDGAIIHDFAAEAGGQQARYIRVRARSIGPCPDWHKGTPGASFLFVDELTVE
ncbi:alpha-1 2-mannosidase [Geothrix limicola]|uniref:Alpha-1 2-mannosidase n=1 Tax=Geothrix limicola TaxID=2927978 RepID=A0ABQ5QH29_9BACT|nr:GH92 family glycosyl hydrolase [Geothrix limicola]GLH73831.1 alpha-1 2-mannosidase [Geothrix limicola]